VNEAILAAGAATISRDALRRSAPPLAGDCEHDMEQLPVIDFGCDSRCRRCGGLVTTYGAG
jgi:hypothetical protein